MISFVQSFLFFVLFMTNGFFVFYNGTTTFLSHTSSGINIVGFVLAVVQFIYFAPGAHRFVDGLFRFKYGVTK